MHYWLVISGDHPAIIAAEDNFEAQKHYKNHYGEAVVFSVIRRLDQIAIIDHYSDPKIPLMADVIPE